MAEWSRETPWRQGCVLTDETVEKFALRDARAQEVTLVVVVSHDCDLAASPDKEPEIELIVGRQIEKADGNFTHAKSPRVLHIEFATPDGGKFVELSATKKVRLPKAILPIMSPDASSSSVPQNNQFFSIGSRHGIIVRPFPMRL